jgi:hypothetical protein
LARVVDRLSAVAQTTPEGPSLELRRSHGVVRVWALGEERFSIRAPACDEEIVVGFEAACVRAQRLARGLD